MRMTELVFFLGLFLIAPACGGGGGGGGGDGGPADTVDGGPDLPTADRGGRDGPGKDAGSECNPNWVLKFFALEDGMPLTSNKSYAIQASLFNPAAGEWLSGETVSFSISGEGDAQFVTAEGVTNESGVAEATLDTGADEGVQYTLTISHPCTGSASLTVHVQQPAMGSLFVTLEVSDDVLLIDPGPSLEVYVDELSTLCAAAVYTDPLGQKVPLPAGESTVEIPNVVAGPAYIVVGVARDLAGQVIGAACEEGVNVLVDVTTDVALTLAPLALDPAGTYQFELNADFSTLLDQYPEQPGAILLEQVAGMGDVVAARILTDMEPWFEDGFPEECGDVPAEIASAAGSATAGFPPNVMNDLAAASPEVLDHFLDSVIFSGKLKLEAGVEPGKFLATVSFAAISYNWDGLCFWMDTCPEQLQLVPKDKFDYGEIHLQLDEQQFELALEGYDQCLVSPFDLGLSPGRFKLYAFVSVFMRSFDTGNEIFEFGDGVGGLFNSLVDCEELLDKVDEETMTCLKLSASQIDPLASCQAALGEMKDSFYEATAVYTAPQHLAAQGEGLVLDENGDLEADGLTGQFHGDYIHDGEAAGAFQYPFTAEK